MRRPVVAALVEDERPRRYVCSGRRAVNPKTVYGSQRGDAQALYRRINGWPARPTKPMTLGREIEAEPPSTSPVDP